MTELLARVAGLGDLEASFCKIADKFAGSELAGRIKSGDLSMCAYEELALDLDSLRGGELRKEKGLSKVNGGVKFQQRVEGGGVGYPTTEWAATTLQNLLWQVAYQAAFDKTTGAAASGTPTTTSVTEGTPGAHAMAAAVDIGLALFQLEDGDSATRYEWAAYTYDTATLTLLTALPVAPVADQKIYGIGNLRRAQTWAAGALPYSLAVKFISTALQSATVKGGVSSFAIAEAEPNHVPMVDWTLFGVNHVIPGEATYPTLAELGSPPNVLPGWNLQLGLYGSTTMKSILPARISWPEFTTWSLDEDQCARDLDTLETIRGSGWTRLNGNGGIAISCPRSVTPPAACAASTFQEMAWSQDVDDVMHAICSIGRTPGFSICRYLPRCRVHDWMGWQDANGKDYQKFVLKPDDELYGSGEGIIYQSDLLGIS